MERSCINLSDSRIAQIVRDTLVDVSTPNGSIGVIAYLSMRNGVKGARVTLSNPLCWGEPDWYPLKDLKISGEAGVKVVTRYL